MLADVETIKGNFVGDFKVGDNIRANAKALCRLSAKNEDRIFNKLIIVQVGVANRGGAGWAGGF